MSWRAIGIPQWGESRDRALLALCETLLQKSLKGGLVAIGGLNLGGGIDPIYNAVGLPELAVEKGTSRFLMLVSARK